MAVASSFAERLKKLREGAALSQYQLAKQASISKQAINQLEKGASEPSWETVVKIARALGVSVDAFDTGDDPREGQSKRKPKK